MGVKLSKQAVKTVSDASWREDEKLIKLRRQLSRRADDSLVFFEDTKAKVVEFQRKRVKSNTVTYEDVASRGLQKLVEAVARDKSFRSNIVGQQMQVLDQVNHFKEALSLVRRTISTGNYGVQLRKEFKTVAAQRDAIDHFFIKAVQASKQGDFVIKLIELVIADIDQSAYNDQRLLKAGELIWHPGRAD